MGAYSSLFISHGSPLTLSEDRPARRFLLELGKTLPKPSAVVAASGHWCTEAPAVGAAATPETIHDFYGFPQFLFERQYPAPGAPALAARVAALTGAAIDPTQGLDHGIWTVMSLLWPEADVPVVPLSVQPNQDPRHHYALGQALRPLADEGVLVIGTGAATHNLRAYMAGKGAGQAEPWALAFTDWLAETTARGDLEALLDYRARAPNAVKNHPTDEHLLPYYVALGAARLGQGERIHESMEYGVISMDAYGFR